MGTFDDVVDEGMGYMRGAVRLVMVIIVMMVMVMGVIMISGWNPLMVGGIGGILTMLVMIVVWWLSIREKSSKSFEI